MADDDARQTSSVSHYIWLLAIALIISGLLLNLAIILWNARVVLRAIHADQLAEKLWQQKLLHKGQKAGQHSGGGANQSKLHKLGLQPDGRQLEEMRKQGEFSKRSNLMRLQQLLRNTFGHVFAARISAWLESSERGHATRLQAALLSLRATRDPLKDPPPADMLRVESLLAFLSAAPRKEISNLSLSLVDMHNWMLRRQRLLATQELLTRLRTAGTAREAKRRRLSGDACLDGLQTAELQAFLASARGDGDSQQTLSGHGAAGGSSVRWSDDVLGGLSSGWMAMPGEEVTAAQVAPPALPPPAQMQRQPTRSVGHRRGSCNIECFDDARSAPLSREGPGRQLSNPRLRSRHGTSGASAKDAGNHEAEAGEGSGRHEAHSTRHEQDTRDFFTGRKASIVACRSCAGPFAISSLFGGGGTQGSRQSHRQGELESVERAPSMRRAGTRKLNLHAEDGRVVHHHHQVALPAGSKTGRQSHWDAAESDVTGTQKTVASKDRRGSLGHKHASPDLEAPSIERAPSVRRKPVAESLRALQPLPQAASLPAPRGVALPAVAKAEDGVTSGIREDVAQETAPSSDEQARPTRSVVGRRRSLIPSAKPVIHV